MGIRQALRQSKQVIELERRDERSRHARLLVMRDMLFAVLATLGLGIVVLGLARRAGMPTQDGYAVLPFLVIAVAALTWAISERRHRSQSPEYRRATAVQSLIWLPLMAPIFVVVQLLLGQSLGTAVAGGVACLLAYLIGSLFRYWRASAKLADDEG